MKFKPLNETEIQISNLLAEGTYQFEVMEATDEISKSGNEMIKLKLKIEDMTGSPKFVYDYLVEAMKYKLIHFAKCTNLLSTYENGELEAHDCIGKRGHVEIYIDQGRMKPDGTLYPAKNAVSDYITAFVPPEVADNQKPFINDDVPF